MSDLDFDELHAQVSKLMDQATKPKAKKTHTKPTEKAEKVDSHKEVIAEAPHDDGPTHIAVRRPVAQIVPKRGRTGIAMDIVQPAKPSVTPPSTRASRTSVTLHPTGPVDAEPPKPREATPPAEKPEEKHDVSEEMLASLDMHSDSPRQAAKLEPVHEGMKSTFPDPLDVHGFTEEEDKPSGAAKDDAPTMEHKTVVEPDKPEAEKPSEPEESKADQPAPTLTEKEPATTPFVNAKVEKRPLGAFAAAPAPPVTVTVEEPVADDGKKEEAPAEAPIAPTPKELDPELVAVESSEPEFTPTSATPVPAAKPTSVNDLRQMAIPPQYKEADPKQSKDDRPIFDTKTYHPPIAPPGKAHKGGSHTGRWVSIAILILAVAAAATVYYVIVGDFNVSKLF